MDNLLYLVFYTLTWAVLNESFKWHVVLIGAIISAIVLYLTDNLLFMHNYGRAYRIDPFILFQYLFWLIIQIYRSGFVVIKKIILGRDEVYIKEYTSCLEDGLAKTLLANAITLTPGTVTMDLKDDKLIILSFKSQKDKDPDFSIRRIERVLSGK
ncbi:MAG: Na+/H+ antiporter subunit E [Clostridiales bacterium]|nr:Na+/H+ antiporter subunit E [Clostridiales bacterium]